MVATNLSYGTAQGSARGAIFLEIALTNLPPDTEVGGDVGITAGETDYAGHFTRGSPYYLSNGVTLSGYTELSNSTSNVGYSNFLGPYDGRCQVDPDCRRGQIANTTHPDPDDESLDVTTEYFYLSGPVVYHFRLSNWSDKVRPVAFSTDLGTMSEEVAFGPTTTTPEPVSLTLLATGLIGVAFKRRRK